MVTRERFALQTEQEQEDFSFGSLPCHSCHPKEYFE